MTTGGVGPKSIFAQDPIKAWAGPAGGLLFLIYWTSTLISRNFDVLNFVQAKAARLARYIHTHTHTNTHTAALFYWIFYNWIRQSQEEVQNSRLPLRALKLNYAVRLAWVFWPKSALSSSMPAKHLWPAQMFKKSLIKSSQNVLLLYDQKAFSSNEFKWTRCVSSDSIKRRIRTNSAPF